jgi:hypothetical protein
MKVAKGQGEFRSAKMRRGGSSTGRGYDGRIGSLVGADRTVAGGSPWRGRACVGRLARKGTGNTNSDYDIGLYYAPETALDTSRLSLRL